MIAVLSALGASALMVVGGADTVENARATPPESLSVRRSADGEATLRALLHAGTHPDLQWSDFKPIRPQVIRFYDRRSNRLAWSSGAAATSEARAISEILQHADLKGLEPCDYDGPLWAERIERLEATVSPATEHRRVLFDVAMTVTTMRYVSDLRTGRINPRHLGLDLESEAFDLASFLEELVDTKDVSSKLESIEPPFAAYRRALAALAAYRRIAAQDDGADLPVPSRTIGAGDRYVGAVRLARLLRLIGDLPTSDGGVAPDLYDESLAQAVRRFQARHGLEPDGRLGRETIAALRVPLSRRAAQLALTIERWRWVPHRFVAHPIVVNIPEYRLYGVDPGRRFTTKVAAGKAYGQRTPVFTGELTRVVFRPYWNVPLSIQREEILPRLTKDTAYLDENEYEIVDREGRRVAASAASPGTLSLLRSGALRLRQRPGPENALGLVKFVVPNAHDVLLHGTPVRGLFARPRRAVTHGCIRVEDPSGLAAWVLRDIPEWTPDHIDAAMSGRTTVNVILPRAIPVLVLYGTALVDADGEVRFFEDIYGHDAVLERALSALPQRTRE